MRGCEGKDPEPNANGGFRIGQPTFAGASAVTALRRFRTATGWAAADKFDTYSGLSTREHIVVDMPVAAC